MLRRNFLKLLGLIPFVAVTKPATGGIIGKGPKLPIHIPEVPNTKYFARVELMANESWSYGVAEIELTNGCIPKIGESAYLMLDGRVGDSIRRTYKHPMPVGNFLSVRYQKNV